MVHDWAMATDTCDTMVRALLLDYLKALDLIDHRILMNKLGPGQLGLPGFDHCVLGGCIPPGPPAEEESWGGGHLECLGASAWRGPTGNSCRSC